MFLVELFALMENDSEHQKALDKTGYWGKQGAGCIFLARDTKRFLISHRSRHVEQPGTWGTFGGAIDPGENPETAVRREAMEEAGYRDHLDLVPLYVFRDKSFHYYNFLAVVDHEFTPELNWETQGYVWCEYGKWPAPLHFGLKTLLSDPESIKKIEDILRNINEPS